MSRAEENPTSFSIFDFQRTSRGPVGELPREEEMFLESLRGRGRKVTRGVRRREIEAGEKSLR